MNEFINEVINLTSEACGIPAEDIALDFALFNEAIDCMKSLGMTEDEALDYVAEHWKFNF
jgi:hypothetical protein